MLRRTMGARTNLTVKPEGHLLIDEPLKVKINGLNNQQTITIQATIKEGGIVFESCCCYMADDKGEIDLSTQPSLSGSYTGVSPMGIFWSMVPAQGQKEGVRLMKKDVSTPMSTNISGYNGHLTTDVIHNTRPAPIVTTVIQRWYKAPGVRTEVVRAGRLRGILYLPPGDGPFPGVIDMFGTVGGLFEFRSALLASRGFATYCLPYFAYEDLPPTLVDLDLEYFLEAADWLSSHKEVFSDGIGVVGVSRGADMALQMAINSPKVRCAVSINGCSFNPTWGLMHKDGYIPPVPFQFEKLYEEDGAFVCNECWDYTKEDLLPVWKCNTKILSLVGEDDKLNPWRCSQFLKDQLPPDKKDNFEIVTYPGAGHLMEPPFTPLSRISYHKVFDMKFLWGGFPKEHAFAQEDSWRRILDHFNKYIPRTSASLVNSKL